MKKVKINKIIFVFLMLFNTLLILSIVCIVNHYKEDIYQRFITEKQSADVIMFGDSHTQGGLWGSLINGYSVKKFGWGGFTSDQLKNLINHTIKYNPKYVFILCGGNDIDRR